MTVLTIAPLLYPILGGVAVVAGAIDAIAGGGGLITVPALVLGGLPPVAVFGTNKLQSVCGTTIAAWRYHRAGLWQWRPALPSLLATLAGAALGALALETVRPGLLKLVVPLLLLGIALWTVLSPRMGDAEREARIGAAGYLPVTGAIGFYDGFFGPGAGQFYALTLVTLRGFGLTRATGLAKPLNVASNLASLGVFIAGGHVAWLLGLVMAVGSMSGALIGSRIATRFGARAIRPLLIAVSLALTARLVWNWLVPV